MESRATVKAIAIKKKASCAQKTPHTSMKIAKKKKR